MMKTQCLWIVGLLCTAIHVSADTGGTYSADEQPDSIAPALSSAIAFAPSISGTANPYAYAVSGSWSDDNLTVAYSLNAPAKDVNVVFMLDGVEVYRTALTAANSSSGSVSPITTGAHSHVLSTAGLGRGDYTWQVEVTPTTKSSTNAFKSYQFNHPQGVDVVNDPSNPYFGYVLVTEGRTPSTNHHSHSSKGGSGRGIYVFDPTLTDVKNSSKKAGFDGGMTFSEALGAISTSSSFRGASPRKIRVADDGRIFVTTQANNFAPLYVIPSLASLIAGDAWTNVFPGLTWDATNYGYKDNGSFIVGPNVSMALKGSGDDLQIALLSGETSNFFNGATNTANAGYSHLYVYNLGSSNQWTTGTSPVPAENTPERAISATYPTTYMYANLEYDPNGGLWFCQTKSSDSSKPTLASVNQKGVTTFVRTTEIDGAGGAVRLSPDKSRIAFCATNMTINIFDITGYDDDGTPQISASLTVDHGLGNKINDIAWDCADNIYVVDNNQEYFAAYALPTNKVVSTPAPVGSGFTIDHDPSVELELWSGTPVADSTKLNSFAYDVRSEIDYDTNEFVVTYKLNAPAKSVTLVMTHQSGTVYKVILEEAESIGEIDPEGYLAVGEHVYRHKALEYASGVYTWSVDVESFPYTGVYLTHKLEFYRPYGIDVVVNPDSPYFGRVMVCEGYTPAATKKHSNGNPYHGNNTNFKGYEGGGTSGLYMFNPDFSPVVNKATGKLAFTGGLDITSTAYNIGHDLTGEGSIPYKVRTNDDASRIFVTTQSNANCPLYELPGMEALENGDAWTPFLEGAWDTDSPRKYVWRSTQGKDVMGVNVGFDVLGVGDNMQMLVTSANDQLLKSGVFKPSHTMAGEFSVGSWNTWDGPATNVVEKLHGNYVSHYTGSNVAYDKRGGVWFNQGRSYQSSIPAANTIFCYFNNSTESYKQTASTDGAINHAGGGLRLSPDLKRMAVSTGTGNNGQITVYNVAYSEDNIPTISPQFYINVASVMGKGVTDIAWDLADNLYVTSNYGEYAAVYSLPRAQPVTSTRATTMFGVTNSDTGALTALDRVVDDVVSGATAAVRGTVGAIVVEGVWTDAAVYDLTGRLMGCIPGSGAQSTSTLPIERGVYVVVVDQVPAKISVR